MQLHGTQLKHGAKVFDGRRLVVNAYAVRALRPLAYRVHAGKLICKLNHYDSPNNYSITDANALRLLSSFGDASHTAQGNFARC